MPTITNQFGFVIGWGDKTGFAAESTNVFQISTDYSFSSALTSDGIIVDENSNISTGGLTNIIQIAAGLGFRLALKNDGTVVAWGGNTAGQTTIPAGLSSVVQIAAGDYFSLALKSDGTVVGWGFNRDGQITIPIGLTNVVQVAAGGGVTYGGYSLALKSDGTVVGWGRKTPTIPAGLTNVVQIAAGDEHALALISDGTVVGFGIPGMWNFGQIQIPFGLTNVVQIAAAGYHSLALTRTPQIIKFLPFNSVSYGGTTKFPLNASVLPNQPLKWTSSNTNVGVIIGTNVTVVGAGTTTITASQAVDANGLSATPVSQRLIVNQGSQTITGFSAFGATAYGSNTTLPLLATNSSGRPLTWTSSNTNVAVISGTNVTVVGAGTTTITASQAGDANWAAATPVSQTLVVNQGSQTITGFSAFGAATYGSNTTLPLRATNSSGQPLTWTSSNTNVAVVNGTNVTVIGAGTTTITASQSGDVNWLAATPVIQTLVVNKASQSISFPAQSNQVVSAPFSPAATSSSGLTVNFSVISGPAVITNGQCVFTNIGPVVLAADQSGNGNYLPASQVTRSFRVVTGDTPFFTTVGDPRNPCEDAAGYDVENSGIGYVGQLYQISVSEITNLMYARFLNAVAAGDNYYGLYTTYMATDTQGGIIRGGRFPNYTYTVKAGFENKPVNFVSLHSVLRYINWLHNGMPASGILDDTTTEDGAYTLHGNNVPNITRNASAKYFLPSQDEWHKAAFFDPMPADTNFPSDYYWPHADQSQNGQGGNFSGTLADVGTSGGMSHYGTYDQDGNATEWTESLIYNPVAGLYDKRIISAGRPYTATNYVTQIASLGFRVGKTIPQSTTDPLITPQMVSVGLPNNLGDQSSSNRGSVAYAFQMGAYEVSNKEYASFLNAVAQNDSLYRLYSTYMGTDPNGGIMRSGSNGSFVYTVKSGFENKPVNFVNVYSAMRFCNWLHNGAQPNGDTEEGAYRLLGNATANITSVQRNTSARYFLPSVDEWHKAAFYDPSPAALPSASYWTYATKSQQPSSAQINYSGANYGSLTAVSTPGVASYFGAYGQSGNAAEWTEDLYQDPSKIIYRVVAGGNWASPSNAVSSQGYVNTLPVTTAATTGFRVASITGMPLGPTPTPTPITSPVLGTFSIQSKVYGAPSFALTPPSSTSTGSWSYSSSDQSIATIAGNIVTIKGAGSALITAVQAAKGNYDSATTSATLIVNGMMPNLGAFTIPAKVYGAPSFGITQPTSTSRGGWSYASGNSNVATVSGNIVTIMGAGTAVITATQAASGNYASAFKTATLTVSVAVPNLTGFVIPPKVYGDVSFTISAPITPSGGVFSFKSSNTNIATVTGNIVTIRVAGTAVITATQAVSGNYAAANTTSNLVVSKASQTIYPFTPTNNVAYGSVLTFTNTNSSAGLPVTFAVKSGPATLSGNKVTIIGVGAVVLTASQAGNGNYNSAQPITNNFTTVKANQTVNFTAPPVIPYGTPVTLKATASSGLAISSYISSSNTVATISGSTLTPKTNGVVTITAVQSGNANYNQASNSVTIQVEKPQSITFTNMPTSVSYSNGLSLPLSAKVTSSNAINYTSSNTNVALVSGANLLIQAVGSSTITASQGGDGIWAPALSVSRVIAVTKGSQVITFTLPATNTFTSNGLIPLNGVDSANLPITYISGNNSILTISGTNAVMKAKGTTTVTASQSGNSNYNAATKVVRTIILK